MHAWTGAPDRGECRGGGLSICDPVGVNVRRDVSTVSWDVPLGRVLSCRHVRNLLRNLLRSQLRFPTYLSFFFFSGGIVFNKKSQSNNGAIVWFSSRTPETAQLAQHLLPKTNPDQPENRLPQVCSDPSPAVVLYLLCSTCASVCPELPSCHEPLPHLHAGKAAPVQPVQPTLGLLLPSPPLSLHQNAC